MFLTTTGCYAAAGADDCAALHRTTYDQVAASGLLLKPSTDMHVTFSRIEEIYQETQQCVGVVATGPAVEFTSFSHRGLPGTWAVHIPVAQTILINTDEDDMLRRDCKTDEEALRHEFVHHLLHAAGSAEENRNHQSPYFEKCGVGVNTYN